MPLLILLTISSLFYSCVKEKSPEQLLEEKIVLVEFIKRLEMSESNPYHENLEKEDH